jgi:hypothetical protein
MSPPARPPTTQQLQPACLLLNLPSLPAAAPAALPCALPLQYVELFGRIRSELIRSGYVPSPHVYVHPSCGAAALPKLQEAVRSLKGELVQSESAPGVTHVVLPFPEEGGDPDDGKHYARTLQVGLVGAAEGWWRQQHTGGGTCQCTRIKREQRQPLPACPGEGSGAPTTWHPALRLQVKGGDARVHWLYLPDSYDEWIPAAAAPAPGAEPQRKPPRSPWRVYVRWLTDSERYNEWMNPADYETAESAEAEGKRKREGEEEEPARKVGAGAGGCVGGGWQVGVGGKPWAALLAVQHLSWSFCPVCSLKSTLVTACCCCSAGQGCAPDGAHP